MDANFDLLGQTVVSKSQVKVTSALRDWLQSSNFKIVIVLVPLFLYILDEILQSGYLQNVYFRFFILVSSGQVNFDQANYV